MIYRKLEYTNIVYLQFRDWYHFNTSWFIYYVLYVNDYI